MPDILTLLQCLQPYIGATSMRQLSRIVPAMLASDGPSDHVGDFSRLRARVEVIERYKDFLVRPYRGQLYCGCFSANICGHRIRFIY